MQNIFKIIFVVYLFFTSLNTGVNAMPCNIDNLSYKTPTESNIIKNNYKYDKFIVPIDNNNEFSIIELKNNTQNTTFGNLKNGLTKYQRRFSGCFEHNIFYTSANNSDLKTVNIFLSDISPNAP